ncbi:TRAP transporter small permease subunit [Maritalea mediterranea]|uniref:TRAP transporter small permease protein n=1 Tax=Maritalea mediterranea TaxID=2909667 RepID=A0ABS9E2H8_9HYPH|nr:TRAP transporter small permease subunit [Maritalea mediterranea]MCF4097060.1 TRAP transporter small permease subunit [Maritalea mediterranea]
MRIADWLDRFAIITGHTVKWLAILMLLVQFGIVISRYAFGVNSIAVQELVLYLHASHFMIAAAYTLQVDGHVRVDIFYARFTPKNKALIDIVGHLIFLLPAMCTILYFTWPSVRNAWAIKEGAISVGGLPASFLLKTLIPVFCVLLILQSISCLVRNFHSYFEKA